MPQSLHHKYGHIIFSTKDRLPLITPEIEPRLYEYLGGILRASDATLLEINGTPDHIHILLRETKSTADQDFLKHLKGDSSHWFNATFPTNTKFAWQRGYAWFSVGPQDVEAAAQYIRNQKEHHKKVTFQDEFRKFLRKYNVEHDERYLWD